MRATSIGLLLVFTGVFAGACREGDDSTTLPRSPVATDQSNEQADVELTRRVRDALVDSEALSMMGKNVVIVSANGKVVLSGEVETSTEKEEVERIARGVSGVTNVESRITVKT